MRLSTDGRKIKGQNLQNRNLDVFESRMHVHFTSTSYSSHYQQAQWPSPILISSTILYPPYSWTLHCVAEFFRERFREGFTTKTHKRLLTPLGPISKIDSRYGKG